MFKAFFDLNHAGYDVRMWINGVDLGIKDADMNQDIKLFNTNHPLKEELADAPPFITEDMLFVIEEGENTIRIEWQKGESNVSPQYLLLVIRSEEYPSPLFFHYADGDESGELERTVDITFDSPQEYDTTIGNLGPGFIHFAGQTMWYSFELNEEDGGYVATRSSSNTSVIRTDSNVPKTGENKLTVEYETDGNSPVSYLIVAPDLSKRVAITESGEKKDTHRFMVS